MIIHRPKKDIVEIFGYAPNDTSQTCRSLWNLSACPFIKKQCIKQNHDQSVIYGTCSVTTPFGDCVICPNRFYANNFHIIKTVAHDAFGDIKFYTYQEYIDKRDTFSSGVVALGMHSGHEIGLKNCSMDWVLAKIEDNRLINYTGIEVQSIDITGNYRDTWYAYKNINDSSIIPKSEHGLNWANVHKRLIPQIIRKSLIYSKSNFVTNGLYFIVPDIVFKKFEEIIGTDIPLVEHPGADIITVYTYGLDTPGPEGTIRDLIQIRKIRFTIDEFSKRFISGQNLPPATELDNAIKKSLGLLI